MNTSFCNRPFEELEINESGDVFTCCPNWNNAYSIGNLYKNSFEEVWNSDKAIELRKRVMRNDYSLCDKNGCAYLKQCSFPKRFDYQCKPKMDQYPLIVKFLYDTECNIACKICRDHKIHLSDERLALLNSKIDTFFLPMLKDAKILIINAGGDPFGSRHSRLVIKKAGEKYPDLKFDFHTNGILCNKANLKELNVTPNRISQVRISIHAATPEMYGKIVPGGEKFFPIILDNLKYLSTIQHVGGFKVCIHFVISAINYTEIPQFIELAEKYECDPHFWEFRYANCIYDIQGDLCVYKPEHPMHQDLVRVLQHPKVKQYKNNFSAVFYDLIGN